MRSASRSQKSLLAYTQMHAAVWPGVLAALDKVNIRNYSIYLGQIKPGEYLLFSYFEYVGNDFQRDMAAVFREAHLVALPSYREGLSKALIEACAIGRAIVTTDVPGCRDVVEDGKNGLLVPARDARQLAAALARLIDRPDQRREMGQYARRKAEQEFSIDQVITQTFHLYESAPCH